MPNKKKVVRFRKVLQHEVTNTMLSISTLLDRVPVDPRFNFCGFSQTSLNNPTVPIYLEGVGGGEGVVGHLKATEG